MYIHIYKQSTNVMLYESLVSNIMLISYTKIMFSGNPMKAIKLFVQLSTLNDNSSEQLVND